MTTIYHNAKRNRPPYFVPVLFVLGIFIVIGVIVLRNTLASALWRMAAPLSGISDSTLTAGFFAQFASKAVLERENALLRSALASTSAALLDRDALYRENLALKGRVVRTNAPLVASILMRPPATPYDTLIIDAGSEDGVVKGDSISSGGGSVIGSISDVYANTARVALHSAPGTTLDALVRTAPNTDIPVVISGQGGGSMSGEVPTGTNVKVGDIVVFPGLSAQVIGSVSFIEQTSGSSFEVLHLHLPVNLFELQSVFISHTSKSQTNERS